MFTFDEYQRKASAFAAPLSPEMALANAAMGLTGETAEVLDAVLKLIVSAGKTSELVKKHLAQGHALDRDAVAKELGDVQWYAARMCELLHLSLGDVAQGNIAKLTARYGAKFDADASVRRDEPTLPAIPSTRRSGEMRAAAIATFAAEPFAWAGEGIYRQRSGRGVLVKEITDPRRLEGGFVYIDGEGTRYMPSGAYLSGGETHPTDLVGTRLVIAYDAPEGVRP